MVLCGDDRMLQVCDNLSKEYHVVGACDVHALTICSEDMDVLVLPVKGADEMGHVQGFEIERTFWENLAPSVKVFSGMRTTFLEDIPQRKHYYMEDEGVINDNAILTAEGVLNELIGCCARSIYDVTIDVIGYGHCGKVIYEILRNLQLCVRVIRRDCKEDVVFKKIEHWNDCGDIIINTSIQNVMDEKRMIRWTKKPVIIDIATPDVIDVKCAQRLGIHVIKAGNLPGRFASISAGNIIAEYIRGKLNYEG